MLHSDRNDSQDDGKEKVFHFDGEERMKQDVFHSYFALDPDLEVVGVTEDTASGSLDAVVADLTPDIVLMGVEVLGPATVEKLRVIRERKPEAVIVLVAGDYDPEGIDGLREFSRGASTGYAYLSLDTFEKREQLVDTISLAAAGHVIVEPRVMKGLMDAPESKRTLFTTLEPWEREVLKLMVRSFPDDAIDEES